MRVKIWYFRVLLFKLNKLNAHSEMNSRSLRIRGVLLSSQLHFGVLSCSFACARGVMISYTPCAVHKTHQYNRTHREICVWQSCARSVARVRCMRVRDCSSRLLIRASCHDFTYTPCAVHKTHQYNCAHTHTQREISAVCVWQSCARSVARVRCMRVRDCSHAHLTTTGRA